MDLQIHIIEWNRINWSVIYKLDNIVDKILNYKEEKVLFNYLFFKRLKE